MPDVASLSVRIDADTSAAESGLARLNQQVSGAGSAIAAAFGTAAVAGVVALGAGLVGSIKSAADFEKQMSAVGAVAGASAGEMQQLTSAALQLGKDTSFSASEAAKSIEELVKAGVSIEDVLGGGARAALDLAAAGAISVGDAAEIASNALNVFGLKGADMAHVADVIAGAANASAIGVNDYKFSLSAAGAVAATVGISFESLSQAIAVMGNAGIKGSDAGTSLKTMMMNLIPSTDKASAEFNKLGLNTFNTQKAMELLHSRGIKPVSEEAGALSHQIMTQISGIADWSKATQKQKDAHNDLTKSTGVLANAFFDADGKAKSFGEISEILKIAMKGLTKEQQLASLEILFGSDAIRAGAVMAEAGADGFDKMAEAMGKVTAQQVAEERLNNLWGSVEKLKGSLETGAIILGGMFTPKLKEMADMLTGAVNQGIDALEQLPDVIETVKQVLAGEWAPDSSIRPFTNAVGEAAIVLRDQFGPTVQAVSEFLTGTLIPAFQRFAAPIAAFAAGFGGTLVTIGLASVALGVVAAALGFLLSPLGLVAIAVGALAAAWTVNFGGIQQKIAEFVEIVRRALGGDVAGAFQQFIALVKATATEIGAQLLLWGQAFVAWVAPMIPPFLAAVADIGLQFIAWIAAQIPLIAAQLLLWAQQFVAWVAPFIPPLLAALATAAVALLGWIAAQIPPIIAQLVLWATEFVAWVAPFIPPLLDALGTAAAALLRWTASQIPLIAAQMLLWSAEFVKWVAPTIPLLLAALTTLGLANLNWIKTQTPLIASQMLLWGQEFVKWVAPATVQMYGELGKMAGTFARWLVETQLSIAAGIILWAQEFGKIGTASAPELAKGLASIFVQIQAFMLTLPAQMLQWGVDAISAFIKGFLSKAIPMPALPSFGGGGGSANPTTLSNTTGASAHVAPHLSLINQVANEMGVPAHRLAALMEVEGSGQTAVSSAGARGLMQVVPGQGYDLPGEDWRDPETSIRQGARALKDKYNRVGSWDEAGRAYFGYGVDAGGMKTDVYGQRYDAASQRYQPMFEQPAAQPAHAPMTRIPLSNAPGGDPSQWPGFMNQVEEQLPAYQLSLETIQGKGAETFAALGVSGTTAGQTIVGVTSMLADDIGNVTRIYQENGLVMGMTVTDAAGTIVREWGTMGTTVTQQSIAMGESVMGSVTTMGAGAVTSVTNANGTMTSIVTDSTGIVTSQTAQMANGVLLSTSDMATGAVGSVNQMAGGTIASITDLAGNTVTTTMDMSGNVISQYTTMATDVIASQTDLSTQVVGINAATGETVIAQNTAANEALVVANNQMHTQKISDDTNAAGITVARYQETSGSLVTIVTDQNGQILADFTQSAADVEQVTTDSNTRRLSETTNALGQTVTVYREASGEIITLITDATGKTVQQFSAMAKGAEAPIGPIQELGSALSDMPQLDMSQTISEMKRAESQAKKTASAIKDIHEATKGGSKSGSGKDSGLGKKAAGGPVDFGQIYLVGEQGPELFMPGASGTIIPNHNLPTPSLMGGGSGGMQTIRLQIELGDRVVEEIVVRGQRLAVERGRG